MQGMLFLAADNATGFLHYLFPTRGSLMLDVVCVAMVAVIPLMAFGISLAKKNKYTAHKIVQVVLCAALFTTVIAFEVEMRLFPKWVEIASQSKYYEAGYVHWSLWIHLCFSVPALLLWIVLIARALKRFPNPPMPNEHSRWHRKW